MFFRTPARASHFSGGVLRSGDLFHVKHPQRAPETLEVFKPWLGVFEREWAFGDSHARPGPDWSHPVLPRRNSSIPS